VPRFSLPPLMLCIMVTACAFLAGCSSSSPASPNPSPLPNPTPTAASSIKHIVIIMQENRSFDNLFQGYPGADTVNYGMSNGQKIPLQPVLFERITDVDHSHIG